MCEWTVTENICQKFDSFKRKGKLNLILNFDLYLSRFQVNQFEESNFATPTTLGRKWQKHLINNFVRVVTSFSYQFVLYDILFTTMVDSNGQWRKKWKNTTCGRNWISWRVSIVTPIPETSQYHKKLPCIHPIMFSSCQLVLTKLDGVGLVDSRPSTG